MRIIRIGISLKILCSLPVFKDVYGSGLGGLSHPNPQIGPLRPTNHSPPKIVYRCWCCKILHHYYWQWLKWAGTDIEFLGPRILPENIPDPLSRSTTNSCQNAVLWSLKPRKLKPVQYFRCRPIPYACDQVVVDSRSPDWRRFWGPEFTLITTRDER